MCEPYDGPVARAKIRDIIKKGNIRFTQHAYDRMVKRHLDEVDITNVLRGGIVEPRECESGTWRYTVRTNLIEVVVVFRSDQDLVVITAWRTK